MFVRRARGPTQKRNALWLEQSIRSDTGKNALNAFLETKVAEGFRIETHTDTHAIIIVGGHRKPLWSRFRKHAAGSRYVVSVDEHGEVTMIPAEPKRN